MKRNLTGKTTPALLAAAVTLLILAITLGGCRRDDAHDDHTYTCPMHPTVISDRPGSCPVCGMDLVLKARPGEEAVLAKEVNDVLRSTNEVVLSNIAVINPVYASRQVRIDAPGIVTYDPKNIFNIAARVSGRLESVALTYPYQPIRKGDLIAEIYSPELITAQRELIFLLQNDRENTVLISAAERKLQLLGLNDSQIKRLKETLQPEQSVRIYSPYSGYVVDNTSPPALPSSSAGNGSGAMENGMDESMPPGGTQNNPAPKSNVSASPLIREGNYVSKGQTLFRIVNNTSLRIELDVPPALSSLIKKGQRIRIQAGSGDAVNANIDFVQPFYNVDASFPKVRVTVKQNDELPVGQLLHASIDAVEVEGIWVPREAVVDLGTKQVTFIKNKNAFTPVTVETGIISGDQIQVTNGLTSSDELAANAQFLMDSESMIKYKEQP